MIFHSNKKIFVSAIPIFSRWLCSSSNPGLREVLCRKIQKERKTVAEFKKEHAKTKVGEITIYNGMRGMVSMIWESSELYPDKGIFFRGYSIEEVRECLPKPEGANEPYVEGILWLLLTGDIPTEEQCEALACDLAQRYELPKEVDTLLQQLPKKMHPLSQFSIAMTALSDHSKFKKAYLKGIKKADYWEYTYEDALDLIARAPIIAGKIYRHSFMNDNKPLELCKTADISYNFAKILSRDEKKFGTFVDFMRLYLLLHCDHEGGNVSAHTAHLVNSTLADPYLSFAASMNGLAGPLHGLATQTTLVWIKELMKKIGDKPTDEKLNSFVIQTMKEGKVVPGYGHAVLRITDPRFIAQMEFPKKHDIKTPIIDIVGQLYKIIPPILKKTGKVSSPWPNVDAHSGALLDYYDIKEMEFYTVMFGVSRAIGVMTNAVWARGMGYPIERPKSITSEHLKKLVDKK